MGAIANLVIYDNAAAIHTFLPVSVTREKGKVSALYRENLATVPVEAQATITVTNEVMPSGVHKVEVSVAAPVMESVSGQNAAGYTAAPKIAHIPRIVVTGFFSGRSSSTNRQFVRQLAANVLNGQITAFTTLTTGPVPDAIDTLVSPT